MYIKIKFLNNLKTKKDKRKTKFDSILQRILNH